MAKEPVIAVSEISRLLINLRKKLIRDGYPEADAMILMVRDALKLRSRSRKGV